MLLIAMNTIAKAERIARQKGAVMAVVEIDGEEDRVIRIVREDYTRSDEFEAFGGEVLYVTQGE